MKIFYQYSIHKTLNPTGGDFINEIGLCTALSKFAEVYYAGQLFKPDKPNFGLTNYAGPIRIVPADISMIRANEDVFNRAKGVRIWISSPFIKKIFEQADYIGTFSEAWTNYLKRGGNTIPNLNDGTKWDKAITLYQTLNPMFKPISVPRAKKFTIGLFGRLVKSTYPHLLVSVLPKLKEMDIEVVSYSTKQKIPLPKDIFSSKSKYIHMPETINSCDAVIVGQHGPEWDICGSLKTLEPMACGVPVILQRSDAREEMFGKNYPLFLDRGAMDKNSGKEDQLIEKIKMIQDDPDLRQGIGKHVWIRSRFYSLETSIIRLRELLNELQCKHLIKDI